MIEMLKKRREDGEEGFTLIELMVVVLIIGILLAIAVPTFLSAQKNAKNKAATSNLRSALSAAKTVYADKQTYDQSATNPFDLSALRAAEPSLGWTAAGGTSTGPDQIAWQSTATVLRLTVKSKLNDCFSIKDSTATDGTGGTYYHKAAGTSAACAIPAEATITASSPDAANW